MFKSPAYPIIEVRISALVKTPPKSCPEMSLRNAKGTADLLICIGKPHSMVNDLLSVTQLP
jgi:hypothetical protein